ncbi:MAG: O-antigen ligase family protein [Flavobacteriales bacterium]|nr:O-antigen ligase family protein [Flavobacteriales bacterium]
MEQARDHVATFPVTRGWKALWLVLVLSLPLSIRFYFPGLGLEVDVPAEPLVAIAVIWGSIRTLHSGLKKTVDRIGPFTVIDTLVLALMAGHLIGALFSTDHVVSVKAMAVQWAFILTFYWFPRTGMVNARQCLERYAWALAPIMFYAALNSGWNGLDRAASNHAAFPFFVDHTAYGAALCFVIPVFLFHAFAKRPVPAPPGWTVLHVTLVIVAICALVFAYSRGAWLAFMIASISVSMAWMNSPRNRWLLAGSAAILLGVILLVTKPASPRIHGQHGMGLGRTWSSLLDSDEPSNADRIMRWRAAWSMFLDEPITGQGPGTYQDHLPTFVDATTSGPMHSDIHAHTRLKPIWGNPNGLHVRDHPQRTLSGGGTAHSEYLLAVSEGGGVLGAPWLVLAGILLTMPLSRTLGQRMRAIPFHSVAVFGTVSYLIHAGVNNFLTDPKLAAPFWWCAAWIALQKMRAIRVDRQGSIA